MPYDTDSRRALDTDTYWDTEIKRAQVAGVDGFPVFTSYAATDISYIANARKLLSMTDRIYPQFVNHNAHTAAAIRDMGTDKSAYGFQRLHDMGESLHDIIMQSEGTRCRIYAPVGAHRDLLAYLVRRLLENGANSSLVNQIVDEEVARDRFLAVNDAQPDLPPGAELFLPERRNSRASTCATYRRATRSRQRARPSARRARRQPRPGSRRSRTWAASLSRGRAGSSRRRWSR